MACDFCEGPNGCPACRPELHLGALCAARGAHSFWHGDTACSDCGAVDPAEGIA